MSLIEDEPGRGNTPEFTVSELSRGVKRTLEDAYGAVRVRGELGRVTFHRNGHVYLDLKDENAVLAGVVWKSNVRGLEIRPQEGDEVIASGRITTFAGQSKYQLVIEQLAYAGEGALLAKLERLRKALAAEGLFDRELKRPIPFLPRVIGVVTSPTGAVIRDILHRLRDRFPVHVLVWPVAVQGPASAPAVAEAIRGFNALAPDGAVPRPDVLIVARGGGSIEDLWGFNEEAVVRAVAASTIPLISAVGHETDTTLIDHAADRRAPTPTAAAEMAVPVRADLVASLADLEARRLRAMRRALDARRERLTAIARALPRGAEIVETRRQRLAALRLPDPRRLVADARTRLGLPAQRLAPGLRARVGQARLALAGRAGRLTERTLRVRTRQGREQTAALGRRLSPAVTRRLATWRETLGARARLLESLSHRRTLARGFVLVTDASGALVTRAGAVAPGMSLTLGFEDGSIDAVARGPGAAEDGPEGGSASQGTGGQATGTPVSRKRASATSASRSAGKGGGAAKPAALGSLFDD